MTKYLRTCWQSALRVNAKSVIWVMVHTWWWREGKAVTRSWNGEGWVAVVGKVNYKWKLFAPQVYAMCSQWNGRFTMWGTEHGFICVSSEGRLWYRLVICSLDVHKQTPVNFQQKVFRRQGKRGCWIIVVMQSTQLVTKYQQDIVLAWWR